MEQLKKVRILWDRTMGVSDEQAKTKALQDIINLRAGWAVQLVTGNIAYVNEFRVALKLGVIQSLEVVYPQCILKFNSDGSPRGLAPAEFTIIYRQEQELKN